MSQKRLVFPLILGRLLVSIVSLIPAIYYKEIVDLIANFSGWDKSTITVKIISILVIIFLIKLIWIVFYRASDYLMIQLYLRLSRKIYLESFEYTHKHAYSFFSNNFTWSLIKKINKLVGAYDRITDTFVFDILSILFNVVFVLIIVGLENAYLSWIFLWWIIIFVIVQYFLYRWNYPYQIAVNQVDSKLSWVLSDTITNNFNIKTFASLRREYKTFDTVLLDWIKKSRAKRWREMVIWATTGVLMVCLEFGIFYVAIKLRNNNLLSLWVFFLLQTYMFKIFDQLRGIGNVFRNLYRWFSEAAEMLEILDTPHEIIDHTQHTLHVDSGKIEFSNITFAYAENKPIFNGLDLRIKPGEKVAIVGQSWSGKTTLIKLLFRFFDIQWGKVLVDGQDIAQVTQDSLRGNISMVSQEPILFHRTIKENIAYGDPSATDEEIIAAAKMARCHSFISKLKYGYDTLVGERWIKLSGWERQRVAIARAILENKRILVLDEATSSLDSESEHLIQEAMDEVMKNKTTIVIAHRLSTIMKMDKIIVMDKWAIIEKWSHKELLAKEGWIYKKLRDIQSGGFIPEEDE